MRKSFLFTLGLPLVLAFASCTKDDNSSNNANTADYYPLKVGNYWVCEDKTIDTNHIVSSVVNGYDSTAVVESGTYFGKSGFKLIQYYNDYDNSEISIDTFYLAKENNKLYIYSAGGDDNQNNYLPFTSQWARFDNWNSTSSWNLIDTTLDVSSIYLYIAKMGTYNMKAISSKGANTTINAANTTFNNCAQTIIDISLTTTLYFDTLGFNGTANITEKLNIKTFYAENIGPVKFISSPDIRPSISSPDIVGQNFVNLKEFLEQYLKINNGYTEGAEKTLVRYKIN